MRPNHGPPSTRNIPYDQKYQDVGKTFVTQHQNQLIKSTDIRQELMLLSGNKGKIHYFSPGEVIINEGDCANAVYIIEHGYARATSDWGDSPLGLSRLGPGQCFGELGVIDSRCRKASVIAETALMTRRIDAVHFRELYDAHLPLRHLLTTLKLAYALKSGKRLQAFWGHYGEQPCTSTIYGESDEGGVIAINLCAEDRLVLSHSQQTNSYTKVIFEDNNRQRELHLTEVKRNTSDQIISGRLIGAAAIQIQADVRHLYQPILNQVELSAAVLNRFRRTGYLGCTSARQRASLICHCFQLGQRDILSMAYDDDATLTSVKQATGIGSICAACEPEVKRYLSSLPDSYQGILTRTLQAEPQVLNSSKLSNQLQSNSVEKPTGNRLNIRSYHGQFEPTALMDIRDVFEVHMMSIASLFSSPSERFMIRTIAPLLPTIEDQALAEHVDDFLSHEANHIVAHEKLNQLLLGEIYPENRHLIRVHDGLSRRFENLPIRLKLAICAGAEYIAVSFFSTFFESFYRNDQTYHRDPVVHDRMVAAGIAPLFHWHASEEFAHRNVAFDLMTFFNTSYAIRIGGYLLLGLELMRLEILAVNALRKQCGIGLRTYLKLMFCDSTQLRTALRKVGKYFLPGFKHAKIHYDFLQGLDTFSVLSDHNNHAA